MRFFNSIIKGCFDSFFRRSVIVTLQRHRLRGASSKPIRPVPRFRGRHRSVCPFPDTYKSLALDWFAHVL